MKLVLCLYLAVFASMMATSQAQLALGLGLLDTIFHAKDLLDVVGGLVGHLMKTSENSGYAIGRAGIHAGNIVPPPPYAPQFAPGKVAPSAPQKIVAPYSKSGFETMLRAVKGTGQV